MPHVQEAVGLVCLWARFVCSLVHGQAEVIEVVFVDLLEVLLDLVEGIATWDVLDHDAGSSLLTT